MKVLNFLMQNLVYFHNIIENEFLTFFRKIIYVSGIAKNSLNSLNVSKIFLDVQILYLTISNKLR